MVIFPDKAEGTNIEAAKIFFIANFKEFASGFVCLQAANCFMSKLLPNMNILNVGLSP